MVTPRTPFPRRFYRAAFQRLEEAQLLLVNEYYTGAIYLSGYAVECILKTLILDLAPEHRHRSLVADFRGHKAHNFQALRHRYDQLGGFPLPEAIHERLLFVSTWVTELRYEPSSGNADEAFDFLEDVHAIMQWAKGRLSR